MKYVGYQSIAVGLARLEIGRNVIELPLSPILVGIAQGDHYPRDLVLRYAYDPLIEGKETVTVFVVTDEQPAPVEVDALILVGSCYGFRDGRNHVFVAFKEDPSVYVLREKIF